MTEGFESLDVWKKGCRLAVDIYKRFSGCRDYGFRDQICRAAISIPSNIAEGYERNSVKDFIRFLNIAKGSNGELRTQLYIAKELDFIENQDFNLFLKETKEIPSMLTGLIKSLRNKMQ